MFIIDLHYIVPIEEVQKHMQIHLEHLEKYYDKNIFICWGPKEPRTGGVIFALAESKEDVEKIIREDPFYNLKVAQFTITELSMAKYQPALELLSK